MFLKLFLDNWGTAYIECADTWLTKTIALDMETQGLYATHSFGPGQTDIPLEAQAPIFELLRPEEPRIRLACHAAFLVGRLGRQRGLEGLEVDYAGPTVYVGPGAVQSVPVRIRVPRGSVQGGTDVVVSIEAVNRPDLTASGKARFIAPTD